MKFSGLKIYAVFLSFFVFCLIIAGGLVTSTGSGLAVPDWPLSFGKVFPEMKGGVFFEHGHRMIAATAGFLTVVLAVWVWMRERRAFVRRLVLWAVAVVVAQGVLGGVTVLFGLPPIVSVAHATLGQTFFCLIVSIAFFLVHPEPLSAPVPAKLKRLAWMTAGFIFFQLVVGAVYRHSGKLLHVHMTGAALVWIHIFLLMRRAKATQSLVAGARTLWLISRMLWTLVLVQVVLGLGSWRFGTAGVTTAHVAVGALLLAGSVLFCLVCSHTSHSSGN